MKRFSVSLCDIRTRSFADTSFLSHMSPVDLRKLIKMNAKENNKSLPVDEISNILKRKRTNLKMLDQNKENEGSESSEEEEVHEKTKKRIVKILSDSEVENNDLSDEDSDDDYEIHHVQKVAKKQYMDCIPKPKNTKMSSYERMVEQKKAERLAFLESLKINEVKSEFADVVHTIRHKKKTKSVKQPVKRVFKKKVNTILPLRKSRRLANLSVDFSEDHLFHQAVKKAELENEKRYFSDIPSKFAFSEALSSEEYETYVKDINIQERKSTGEHFSYDRSIIRKLTLDESNIAKVVPERISSLAWYPSADYLILAAGSKVGNIGIWNVDSESSPYSFKIHNGGSTNLLFNPFDPVKLFSSSYEGTLRCGDMVKHVFDEIYNVSDETSCTYFDFLSSTTCIIALQNGHISVLDRRNSKPCEKKHECHDNSIKTVNVHPVNKHYFLTAENRGSVRLWDLRKLQKDPVVNINHHKRCANSAFFSTATGNSILTTSFDDSICIFNSQNLTEDIKVIRQMKHNNNTGRWLSIFRATWLPNSDEVFAVGSIQDSPRRIQVYDNDLNVCHLLMHENLTTITSINIFHPFRPALAGSNSSGKVFVFK